MGLETLVKLCMTEVHFLEKTFFAKCFINVHWICSIMKSYIICCVPAQIMYWEKSFFWNIGQNALSQWDCRIFQWTISPEQIDDTVSFLQVDKNSSKLKFDWKFYWLGIFKNGCGQSDLWTLKLTVSEEWTDGINWFFACWYKFIQIKGCLKIFGVGLIKNGCGECGSETLKLTLS